jgi:hypothetical protein
VLGTRRALTPDPFGDCHVALGSSGTPSPSSVSIGRRTLSRCEHLSQGAGAPQSPRLRWRSEVLTVEDGAPDVSASNVADASVRFAQAQG